MMFQELMDSLAERKEETSPPSMSNDLRAIGGDGMGRPIIDLAGKRFGRLLVLRDSGKRASTRVVWECKCDCGSTALVSSDCLTRKTFPTVSCGCYHKVKSITHGMSHTGIHRTWANMLQRCRNNNLKEFRHYGGKGITVTPDWLKSDKFMEWAFSNGYRQGLTIDRIDPEGNYEPGNCRFITMSENISRANMGRCMNKKKR